MAFNPRRKAEVEPVEGYNVTVRISTKARLMKLRPLVIQAGYTNFNETIDEAMSEVADNWESELAEGKRRGKGQGKPQAESNGLGNGQV